MINVLLDPLPDRWDGCRIDTSFRIGIQISLALGDGELSEFERISKCIDLLYIDLPELSESALGGLAWFLNGWCHDNHSDSGKSAPVMDYDIDQWRIYSAFYNQYRIDLNNCDLHYWQFMGLLTSLDECAYTRVIDIRTKDVHSKMSPSERRELSKAKRIYDIRFGGAQAEMTEEERARYEEFMRYAKIRRKGGA